MIVTLEVEDGSAKGQKFKLKPGEKVGRTQGDVLVDDSRISALHAKTELDHRNHLVLIDLNSSNGLQINGQQVKRVALLLGVRFLLGKTPVRVVQIEQSENSEKASWRAVLNDFSDHFDQLRFSAPRPVSLTMAFSPAMKMRFIQGALYGHEWILGFGPRRVGSETRDLLIGDPSVPPVAFDLIPTPEGVELVCAKNVEILLNQKPVSRKLLSENDEIICGAHTLKVEFLK